MSDQLSVAGLSEEQLSQLPKAPIPFFNEMPTWDASQNFVINGRELEQLANFVNFFMPLANMVTRVMTKGIQEGQIDVKYTYSGGEKNGQEVPKEEMEKFYQEREKYVKTLEEKLKELKPAEAAPAQ